MIDTKKLFQEALKARENSYSPYSKFKVGAAVLLKNGKYIHGANIENSSFSLCMCAERNSIFAAMNQGYKKDDFVAIGVIADTDDPVSPCGSCRQVMSELLPENVEIHLYNLKGEEKVATIKELLPYSFSGDDIQ
jgi:cytidine deaminase